MAGKLGRCAEWSQSDSVFRRTLLVTPDIVAGQVDVLPAQWGQVSQQLIWDILDLAQGCDGALEISRVPQDDCGDEQVEAGGAVLLVLVGVPRSNPRNFRRAGSVWLTLKSHVGE